MVHSSLSFPGIAFLERGLCTTAFLEELTQGAVFDTRSGTVLATQEAMAGLNEKQMPFAWIRKPGSAERPAWEHADISIHAEQGAESHAEMQVVTQNRSPAD